MESRFDILDEIKTHRIFDFLVSYSNALNQKFGCISQVSQYEKSDGVMVFRLLICDKVCVLRIEQSEESIFVYFLESNVDNIDNTMEFQYTALTFSDLFHKLSTSKKLIRGIEATLKNLMIIQ